MVLMLVSQNWEANGEANWVALQICLIIFFTLSKADFKQNLLLQILYQLFKTSGHDNLVWKIYWTSEDVFIFTNKLYGSKFANLLLIISSVIWRCSGSSRNWSEALNGPEVPRLWSYPNHSTDGSMESRCKTSQKSSM